MATLHVLGCGDAFNSGGRRHTSFLLQKEETQILIDCGATTVLAFNQLKQSFNEVDVIIITHFHGDHYGGLPYLLLAAAKLQKREKPLKIISPPGLKDKLFQLMGLLYKGSEDSLKSFPIYYEEFRSGEYRDFSFGRFVAFEVRHTKESLPHGVRIEMDGKIFAFSGDTAWHENLPALSENADLFICECNFYEKETNSHLNYQTLLEKNSHLKAKRIFLTHLGDEMLEKKNQLEMECLQEGQKIEI